MRLWGACADLVGALLLGHYSLWLDQHSMAEALKFIRTALEACAPAARDEPGFGDVYPLMLDICARQ